MDRRPLWQRELGVLGNAAALAAGVCVGLAALVVAVFVLAVVGLLEAPARFRNACRRRRSLDYARHALVRDLGYPEAEASRMSPRRVARLAGLDRPNGESDARPGAAGR
jgi:hypothetical protein